MKTTARRIASLMSWLDFPALPTQRIGSRPLGLQETAGTQGVNLPTSGLFRRSGEPAAITAGHRRERAHPQFTR